LSTKLEITNKQQDLQKALFFAFERTRSEPFDVTLLIKDVLSEFPNLNTAEIITALRRGGLGMYGRTFKLSTQEVCFWIRQHLKEKQTKNAGRI
jgi:hypothetical protein